MTGGRRRWRRLLGVDIRFWSLHSWSWDDRLADPAIAARIDELTSWLRGELAPGALVVDIGCGTGNHSWSMASSGARVVGVDLAPGMLGKAIAKRSVPGTGSAIPPAFVRADLRDGVPLRERGADGALSVYAAQFFDLATFAAEVARVLRPGGMFLAELPRPGIPRRVQRGLSLRHRGFQRVNAAAAAVGARVGSVRVIPPAEVDAALERSGFHVVGHRDTERSLAVLARLSA